MSTTLAFTFSGDGHVSTPTTAKRIRELLGAFGWTPEQITQNGQLLWQSESAKRQAERDHAPTQDTK